MPFVLDQQTAFADFGRVAANITDPLRPCLIGPQAKLVRFAQAAERAQGLLGSYDPGNDTVYSYPNLPLLAKVDVAYVKINIKDALLRYFQDLTSVGSTVAPVSGYADRVRSSSVVFKTNAAAARATALLRDVQPGDVAHVHGTVSAVQYSLATTVKGFIGEPIAATVAAATTDSGNRATQGLQVSADKIGGPDNCVVFGIDATHYDGLATGDTTETYTVEVLTGSTGGDLSTATLRITSASGNDDVASQACGGLGHDTLIGTRGLTVQFDLAAGASCNSEAGVEGVSADDLVAGQKWRIVVQQAFTKPAATSGGAYTGTNDTTYIITVTRGGTYAHSPQIMVSTTTGVDASGPTVVSAAGQAVAVGTLGVTASFNQTALCAGDRYEIVVTGVNDGALQTITFNDQLPTGLLAATDLDLTLYIKKDIAVTANRVNFAPALNWAAAADTVTVKAGIVAYDSSWLDDSGDEVALTVAGGSVYVDYRAWLQGLVGSLFVLTDPADVLANAGTVDPDNPLAYALFLALTNSNGQPVRYTAVADPAVVADWAEALDLISGNDDLSLVVPLTSDATVRSLVKAHVDAQSAATVGLYRKAFLSVDATTTRATVDSTTASDSAVVLATLADNPDVGGTQYTLLTVTSGNAKLQTLGVVAGDTVRFLFTGDGFGGTTWTEYSVASVINENSLLLATAGAAAVSTPQKVEIWHTLTKDEIVSAFIAQAEAYNDPLVSLIPGRFTAGGVTVPGYCMAACIAGLRGGVAPHQGLRFLEVKGLDGLEPVMAGLTNARFDTLIDGGLWVVAKTSDGRLYTRGAVTTAVNEADVNAREEVIQNILTAVGLYLQGPGLGAFKGTTNISTKTLALLGGKLKQVLESLRVRSFTDRLDALILAYEVTSPPAPSTVFKDHTVITLTLTVAYPNNQIEVTLLLA